MLIYHLALVSEWEAAQASGSYTTSTLGVSLEAEGFIHASHEHQWEGVRERFYRGVAEPLVLLVVDTALLASPVVEEVPDGAAEAFPHVYGPIEVAAVVQTLPVVSPRD
jgi:uncharacterized protein (DUF952 family)